MVKLKGRVAIRGIDLEIYHQAMIAKTVAQVTIGEWVTEAIRQRIIKEGRL